MRHKDADISLPPAEAANNMRSWDSIKVGLLMDIRDELKLLNNKLDDLRSVVKRTDRRLAKRTPLR